MGHRSDDKGSQKKKAEKGLKQGEGQVKSEAETGVLQPQTMEYLEPPETARVKGVPSRAFGRECRPADT